MIKHKLDHIEKQNDDYSTSGALFNHPTPQLPMDQFSAAFKDSYALPSEISIAQEDTRYTTAAEDNSRSGLTDPLDQIPDFPEPRGPL